VDKLIELSDREIEMIRADVHSHIMEQAVGVYSWWNIIAKKLDEAMGVDK